jgi:uncharacterized protein
LKPGRSQVILFLVPTISRVLEEDKAVNMFLIRTFIGASAIHGNGVFAGEEIARGTVIWQYEPNFDRVISDEELAGMPDAFCDYINMYAYRSSDIGGRLLLPCDHAKFLNHSADPNTAELPLKSIARRLIQIGEEMTCDYSKFCADWTGFD